MDKEEVATGEAKPQIVQELQMFARHDANQIAHYRYGIFALQIWRRESIGHECVDTADAQPVLEQGRIFEDPHQKCFVIPLEENRVASPASFDQEVEGGACVRAAI